MTSIEWQENLEQAVERSIKKIEIQNIFKMKAKEPLDINQLTFNLAEDFP